MPADTDKLEMALGSNIINILTMSAKHSRNLWQTVGNSNDVCILSLILDRAVIALRSIPTLEALLGNSALAQSFHDFKVTFGNQFVGSRFF